MAFNIRRIGRTYLWVCLVAIALLAYPVLKYLGLFAVALIAVPFSIIINITKGNYGEAFFQFLIAAGVGFLIYKYFDRILHAAGWVYVVVGDLVKGGQAQPGDARVEVVHGGNTMSEDSLERRGQGDPLARISGNPLDTAAQTIKARLAAKTAEQMTKALRAKTDLYTADNNLGHAMLAHDDTAVELQPKNRDQRRENKQAELDIKAMERQTAFLDAKKKFDEAETTNGKTPQQLEAEQFERKRMYRSFDAQDDVFEDFEFEVTKDLEIGRQYVKMRDRIKNDPELDEEVRNDLLDKLKRQYETRLAHQEGKGDARKKNASA
jgi:hypothetical protein